MADYVSRAGQKLEHALRTFAIDVTGLTCADLGSNVGGFVDCLLQHGANKVYAIEKGYGVLEWKLRKDPRVIVMERINAMHATLVEKVGLVTIDVAWTRQRHILPAARELLRENGRVIALIKPQYEADKRLLRKGVLPADKLGEVLEQVKQDISAAGFQLVQTTASPILGGEGNAEVLAELRLQDRM
jgi:23S rRNA (cytidine1920-2'-O)/16S rRNA (cytidine1409-2'-O)-methyltransferase